MSQGFHYQLALFDEQNRSISLKVNPRRRLHDLETSDADISLIGQPKADEVQHSTPYSRLAWS